ncbi:MAG: hypothetical protein ACLFVC_06675 [Opitutales bacterium]
MRAYGPDLKLAARLAIEHLERKIRTRRYGAEQQPVLVGILGSWREGNSLGGDGG